MSPKTKVVRVTDSSLLFNLLHYNHPVLSASIYSSPPSHNHNTPTFYTMCTYLSYTCNGVRAPQRQGDRNRRCGKVLDSKVRACSDSLKRKDKKRCVGTPQNSRFVPNHFCNECQARATGDSDSGIESGSSFSRGLSTISGGSIMVGGAHRGRC